MARKILFFTGKGGTGKSMVAAGFAMAQAKKGQRVLLIELGETSFFEGILSRGPVGFEAKEVQSNLFVAHWDGYRCLRDYIHFLVKSEAVTNLIYENPFMHTLIDVGPSLAELAMVGKITSGVRNVGPALDYDQLVIDSYATGHMLALLRAPMGIADAVKFGPMASQCREMIKVLRDSQTTGYYIVTLPEELPTTESLELYNEILMEVGVRSDFICNALLDVPLSQEELTRIREDQVIEEPLKVYSQYLSDKLEMQQIQLGKLIAETKHVKKVPRFLAAEPIEVINQIAGTVVSWDL